VRPLLEQLLLKVGYVEEVENSLALLKGQPDLAKDLEVRVGSIKLLSMTNQRRIRVDWLLSMANQVDSI
jgi:hypothetical protein